MRSTSSEGLSPETASALIDQLTKVQERREQQRLFYRLFPDEDVTESDGSVTRPQALGGWELRRLDAALDHPVFALDQLKFAVPQQILHVILTRSSRAVVSCNRDLHRRGEPRPLKQSPQAKALFDQYVGNARDIGLSVGGEFSGGCVDSGFAAAVGAPTVCGTGPVGSKAHSPEEFLELNSIVPRALALALTVLRLT